ncbi:MAG: 50S ribosome-binding GTPase [Fervidobacterium sp.]|nr:50S ribosome-binding GTPase [Fervidobacterium sp.]
MQKQSKNEEINIWYPGHVQKAKKQIKENIRKVDIILITLDARTPVATTSFEIKIFKDKTKIFLLNKSDLSDPNYNRLWLKEISNQFPAILTNKDTTKKELVSFIKSVINKENPHIAVVGVPNVGKSTIINKLLGRHKAKTGGQPGITRGVQWVSVEGLTVLDSPGILYSKIFSKEIAAKLLLIGSLPIESASDDIFEMAFSIYKNAAALDIELYTLLEDFGKKRGFLKKGGIIDIERARFSFFKELSEGKFGRYTYDTDFEKFWEVLRHG